MIPGTPTAWRASRFPVDGGRTSHNFAMYSSDITNTKHQQPPHQQHQHEYEDKTDASVTAVACRFTSSFCNAPCSSPGVRCVSHRGAVRGSGHVPEGGCSSREEAGRGGQDGKFDRDWRRDATPNPAGIIAVLCCAGAYCTVLYCTVL